MISSIADRMLAIFVPRVTAAAGCTGSFQQACGQCLEDGHTGVWHQSQQACVYLPNCTVKCGACEIVVGSNSICI